MTLGMPAMTMTLPIRNPGAAEILLRTSSPPIGHARHAHARLVHDAAGLGDRALHDLDRLRMIIQRDAESLGDAIGGDVVMGRADAAGGEHVGVARTQCIERRDDLRLLVGDDAHFLEIDADAGEIFGDVADILVLGTARQDLVADHQDRGGHRIALAFGRVVGHGPSPCFRLL